MNPHTAQARARSTRQAGMDRPRQRLPATSAQPLGQPDRTTFELRSRAVRRSLDPADQRPLADTSCGHRRPLAGPMVTAGSLPVPLLVVLRHRYLATSRSRPLPLPPNLAALYPSSATDLPPTQLRQKCHPARVPRLRP